MYLQDKDFLDYEEFKAGQSVFIEGHPCLNAYIVTQGKVELTFLKDGEKHLARIAQKGDLLAELDWMNWQKHIFSAQALEFTVCLKVSNATLLKNYMKAPVSVQGIMRNTVNLLLGIKSADKVISAADIRDVITELKAIAPEYMVTEDGNIGR